MAKKRNRGKKKSSNPVARPNSDEKNQAGTGETPSDRTLSASSQTSIAPDSASTFTNVEFGICLAFLIGGCLYLVGFLFAETEIGTRFDAYFSLILNASIYWAYWTGSPEESLHLLDRWPIIAGVCFHFLLASGTGFLTLNRLIDRQKVSPLEHGLLAITLGLGIISTYTLVVGMLHLYTWKLWTVLPVLVCAAMGWVQQLGQGTNRGSLDGESACHSKQHWTRWLGLAALPFLGLLILGSMMPPWEYDVREYHLQVPKEWYQAGGVSFLAHNVYGNMPLGTEMHALFGMLYSVGNNDWWWGAVIGKTVSGLFAILNFGLLVTLGTRLFGRFAGVVAGLIYVSTPWTVANSIIGYNEGALSCYLLAALFAFVVFLNGKALSHSEPKSGPLLLFGMLVGSAISCKYTAVPFLAIPALFVLMWVLDRSKLWNWFQAGGVVLLGIALMCGPWLGKNLVLTGNPTYPLLSSLFPSPQTKGQVKQWEEAHSASGQPSGVDALAGKLGSLAIRYKWLSPLLIPFMLLAFFFPQRKKIYPLAIFLVYVVAVWWLATHRLERFLFPFYPVACLIAGAGAGWIQHFSWKNLVAGIVLLGCVLNFVFAGSRIVGDIRIFASLERLDVRSLQAADYSHPDDQILRLSHLAPEVAWLNANHPDGKVLFFGECRAFEAEFEVIYNTCFDRCQTWLRFHGRSPTEIHQGLVDEKISHLLINIPELNRFRSTYGYNVSDEGNPIDEKAILNLEGIVLERVPVSAPGQDSRRGVILFRVLPVRGQPTK